MRGIFASVSALFSSACCVGTAVLSGMGVGASTAGLLGGVAGFVKALTPYHTAADVSYSDASAIVDIEKGKVSNQQLVQAIEGKSSFLYL